MSCNLFNNTSGGSTQGSRVLTDSEFIRAFERGEVDPERFNHEGHLRLAWILIRQHGVSKASDLLCNYIGQLDRKQGGRKFNRALTLASTALIARRMQTGRSENFRAFLEENPTLLTNFKGLLPELTNGEK